MTVPSRTAFSRSARDVARAAIRRAIVVGLCLGAAPFASFAQGTVAPPSGVGPASALQEKIAAMVGRPGGLTADRVAALAVDTSFDLAQKREQIAAAAAQVDAALVGYIPKLTLLARYTRNSPIRAPSLGALLPSPFNSFNFTFPVLLNQTTFAAQLNIPISDYVLRINQNHKSATRNVKAAELSERATRLKIANDARLAYYAWSRAKLQVLVTEQALVQAQGHQRDTRRLFEAGSVSKADLMRVESTVAGAELLLTRSQELATVLEEQLHIIMHDKRTRAPGTGFAIGEDLRADLPPLSHAHELDSLYGEAFDKRLELRAISESARALGDQVRVQRAGYYPRVDALLEGVYANPNQRFQPPVDEFKPTFAATVQLTWSPNDLFTARAQVNQQESKVKELLAQKSQLEDGIRAEVAQAMQAMREATVAIGTTARGLVAAEESYRVRRELFRAGRGTVVEVTDAETELTRARLEAVSARIDLRIAQVRLTHATGRDVAASDAKTAAGTAPAAPRK